MNPYSKLAASLLLIPLLALQIYSSNDNTGRSLFAKSCATAGGGVAGKFYQDEDDNDATELVANVGRGCFSSIHPPPLLDGVCLLNVLVENYN